MRVLMPLNVALCALALSGAACDDDGATPTPSAAAGRSGNNGSAGRAGQTAGSAGKTNSEAGRAGTASPAAGAGGKSEAGGSGAGGTGGALVDGKIAVTVQFQAKVGDQAFECGREYSDLGTTKRTASPQDFRFFVQDVYLLGEDGSEVPLVLDERAGLQNKDVALIDFTDATGLCGGFGNISNTKLTGRIEPGTYTGIVFSNGVPESLNHQNLVEAKAPLQDPATYWGWQSGYRFIMAEIARSASADEDAGTDSGGDPVTLVHIGSAACTGSVTTGYACKRANRNRVRLTDFDPTKGTVVADFGTLFANVDLSSSVQCHGTAAECAPMYSALGVDIETGEALATQSVFRTE